MPARTLNESTEVNAAGAYGAVVANAFDVLDAPCIVSSESGSNPVAITYLERDESMHELTPLMPPEDAYLVTVPMQGTNDKSIWLRGRFRKRFSSDATTPCFLHMESTPQATFHSPFRVMQFYIPQSAFASLAGDMSRPALRGLSMPAFGETDLVIGPLAAALWPSFQHVASTSQLFVDSLLLALLTHLAGKYGLRADLRGSGREMLAPWQVKRATELMAAHLCANLSLATIARECQLSVSHFARGFKNSVGKTVHQWHLQRRMEHAKYHLQTSSLPICEVALECGFAHRVPFTKAFSKVVGMSPGLWRRNHYTPTHKLPGRGR